jgi:NADPH-dependent 2,4-dienoyl-CoA reductase/sulfur reductase-like enzyme
MKAKIANLKKVVVIGAGFIGVELSDELNKSGHEITLIEKENSILAAAFDEEVSVKVREIIESRGVKVVTGNGIKAITGSSKVEKVQLENGDILDADACYSFDGICAQYRTCKKIGNLC